MILGSVNDTTFGPTLMFGLGGIFVEVLKDVTFRVAPVGADETLTMLSDINGAPILKGVRGEAPRTPRPSPTCSASADDPVIWLTRSRSPTPTR